VEPLAAQVSSVSLQPWNGESARLVFSLTAGQTLVGTQLLARLNFVAVANQVSGFTSLGIGNVVTTQAEPGLPPTPLANHGRVAIISEQPLLEAMAGQDRQLVLYGKPGETYVLESTATPAVANSWAPVGQITLTGVSAAVPVLPSVTSAIFYRARSL
jgi:hypothetical protein